MGHARGDRLGMECIASWTTPRFSTGKFAAGALKSTFLYAPIVLAMAG